MKRLFFALTILFGSCNNKPTVVYTNTQLRNSFEIKSNDILIWRNKKTYYIVTATKASLDSMNKPCYYVQMQYARDKSYLLLTYYDKQDIFEGDTIMEGSTDGEFINWRTHIQLNSK